MEDLSRFFPLLEAVVSYMDEGVLIADREGQVLFQNPAAGHLLGQPGNQPIEHLNRLPRIDLQNAFPVEEEGVDSAGWPNGSFVTFSRELQAHGLRRHLELNTGLIEAPGGEGKLRLVMIRDRTAHNRLDEVLHPDSGDQLTSHDPRMLWVLNRLRQVAPSSASILLQGESGTGKTRLARWIHRLGRQAAGPFVEVNCAAIPESIIESELFGHVRGAFTGANGERKGRFQSADGGTLFLDEVGELPLRLQPKLLKAIQDQEFEMVGSDRPVRVSTRIIAASNRNLRSLVDSGDFRPELYYRLAVIPLTIPPLRERPGDVGHLIDHFCRKLTPPEEPEPYVCSQSARAIMDDYHWPGNVRELENAIEHGILCAENRTLTTESLPQDIREHAGTTGKRVDRREDAQRERQRREIRVALQRANGRKGLAANLLGIDRSTLWRRMQRLSLQ